MRIVWLSLNASYAHSSLALPLAHLACRQLPNWEWQVVTATINDDPADIATRLQAAQPDLIGATLYLFNRQLSLDVLQRLKLLREHCLLAVGGPECLRNEAAQLLQTHQFLDFALYGEAEQALPRLLKALEQNCTLPSVQEQILSSIPGLAWRDNGKVKQNSGISLSEAWSQRPFPCESSFFAHDKPFAQLETSRGCPFSCTYCTSGKTALRFKAIDDVKQELLLLRALGIGDIRLLDRTFNIPAPRAIALLRLFREHFADMCFHLEIHPSLLPPELQVELQAAPPGQLHLEAGIQSLHQATRSLIGRDQSPEQELAGLQFLSACSNLKVHVDLLSGCPEQSWEDVLRDVQGVLWTSPDEIQLEVLKVLPGTPLRTHAAQRGLTYHCLPPYDVMQTTTMTAAELFHTRLLSRMLDQYYNQRDLQPAFQQAMTAREKFIPEFLQYLLSVGLHLGPSPSLRKRFEFFNRYLTAMPLPQVKSTLACHWMICALPPGQEPAKKTSLVKEVPASAVLFHGQERDDLRQASRDTRLWQLELAKGHAWFAYNRTMAPNRAVAAWKIY